MLFKKAFSEERGTRVKFNSGLSAYQPPNNCAQGFGKVLLVESGIQENIPIGIRNAGLWNPKYRSRSPESQ